MEKRNSQMFVASPLALVYQVATSSFIPSYKKPETMLLRAASKGVGISRLRSGILWKSAYHCTKLQTQRNYCSNTSTAGMETLCVPMDKFEQYKADRWIYSAKHPNKDLLIWNYTGLCELERKWDEVTELARALVTDSQGTIVARSFRKFHNYEKQRHRPTPNFTVYDKVDGSLGILFWHENEWIIASRGSFISRQAKEAKSILDTQSDTTPLDNDLAYTFEIVYPGNRHVVDYQDKRALIFLAAFKRDGTEVFPDREMMEKAGFEMVKKFEFQGCNLQQLKNMDLENSEGFIVQFDSGDRAKIKFENYYLLHRFLFDLNGKRVYDVFCSGATFENVMQLTREEDKAWVTERWDELQNELTRITNLATDAYNQLKDIKDPKEFGSKAADFATSPEDKKLLSQLLFMLRNGKDIRRVICGRLKNGSMEDKPPSKLREPTPQNSDDDDIDDM